MFPVPLPLLSPSRRSIIQQNHRCLSYIHSSLEEEACRLKQGQNMSMRSKGMCRVRMDMGGVYQFMRRSLVNLMSGRELCGAIVRATEYM
jgi:hypothetical protein